MQDVIEGGIGFPCFVKPVMSSSGKGQSRLQSQADAAKAWDKALSAGRVREARVIVEGEIAFDFEMTQLTVRAKDESSSANLSATARSMATMSNPGSRSR